MMVTRGVRSTPYQDPRVVVTPATIVIIAEYKEPDPTVYERCLKLFTVHVRRGDPAVQDQKINSHSKLNCILASVQATQAGADEALMLDPGSTRGFERAVGELQQGLFVVKSEERYDPSFSYRWDLVEAWLPDGVREGRRLGRPRAVRRLVGRYLGGAAWSSVRGMARLFGLPAAEVQAAVNALARAGELEAGVLIAGLPGEWVVHRGTSMRRA